MYAIISDWMPFEAQAVAELPTSQMVQNSKPYRREEEFRSALDRYMAEYQKHHALMSRSKSRSSRNSRFTFFHKFVD